MMVVQNSKVSASILAADFANLEREIRRVEQAGVHIIHFDVMDGIFVPNISIGLPVLSSLKKVTDLFMDVHLMITDPIRYIDDFADAGADGITFHVESQSNVIDCVEQIRKHNLRVGLSLRPSTPLETVLPYLDQIDLLLVMSVEPGFGGQKFLPSVLNKISKVHALFPTLRIQVDGGINCETGRSAFDAGALELVAGSYLFHNDDIKKAVFDITFSA